MENLHVGDSLARAYLLMHRQGVRSLPVYSEGRVVGSISARDIESLLSHPHEGASSRRVLDRMKPRVVSVQSETPLENALDEMLNRDAHALLLSGERSVSRDELLLALRRLASENDVTVGEALELIGEYPKSEEH